MLRIEITAGGQDHEPVVVETAAGVRAAIGDALEAHAQTLEGDDREAYYIGTVHDVNEWVRENAPWAGDGPWEYEDDAVSIRVTRAG